jgi:ubiquinone/menaquinone biosynthesis C-methylase UbiE
MEKKESLEIPQIKKTELYYNAISKGYKELYHDEQIKKISLVKNNISKTGNTLDLGSGDGVLNKFIENQKNFISLDLSFEMLKKNPNNTKIQASITNIPIKNNSLDSVISFTTIQDIEDTSKAISEINRILKSKGDLIVSFLKNSSKKESILENIEKYFKIIEKIEEEKDLILICKKE